MQLSDYIGSDATSSLQGYFNAAIGVNNGSAYDVGKTSQTVPTDAIQSMTPVTANVTTPGWDQFLQNTLGGLVGYAIKKDAVANGVAPAATQPAPAAAPVNPMSSLLVPAMLVGGLLLAGVVVYKLVK
jgi:hypothetical protein